MGYAIAWQALLVHCQLLKEGDALHGISIGSL